MTTLNENGKNVSKNWLIAVLVSLVAFFAALSIVQHLNANNETDKSVIKLQTDMAVIADFRKEQKEFNEYVRTRLESLIIATAVVKGKGNETAGSKR